MYTWIFVDAYVDILECTQSQVQGGEDRLIGCLKLQVIFAKEPLLKGLIPENDRARGHEARRADAAARYEGRSKCIRKHDPGVYAGIYPRTGSLSNYVR